MAGLTEATPVKEVKRVAINIERKFPLILAGLLQVVFGYRTEVPRERRILSDRYCALRHTAINQRHSEVVLTAAAATDSLFSLFCWCRR